MPDSSAERTAHGDKSFIKNIQVSSLRGVQVQTELPEASVEEIESAWGGLMREIGYEFHSSKRTANIDSGFAESPVKGLAQ